MCPCETRMTVSRTPRSTSFSAENIEESVNQYETTNSQNLSNRLSKAATNALSDSNSGGLGGERFGGFVGFGGSGGSSNKHATIHHIPIYSVGPIPIATTASLNAAEGPTATVAFEHSLLQQSSSLTRTNHHHHHPQIFGTGGNFLGFSFGGGGGNSSRTLVNQLEYGTISTGSSGVPCLETTDNCSQNEKKILLVESPSNNAAMGDDALDQKFFVFTNNVQQAAAAATTTPPPPPALSHATHHQHAGGGPLNVLSLHHHHHHSHHHPQTHPVMHQNTLPLLCASSSVTGSSSLSSAMDALHTTTKEQKVPEGVVFNATYLFHNHYHTQLVAGGDLGSGDNIMLFQKGYNLFTNVTHRLCFSSSLPTQ